MNSLAVAIHERSSQTNQLANSLTTAENNAAPGNSEPEMVSAASHTINLQSNRGAGISNPTEVCVVYLREKIAQLIGLVDAINQRQEYVRSYMLKDALRNTKKNKRSKLYEQARNYAELQTLDSNIIQLENLMQEDKASVLEMNSRILSDL